MSQIISAGTVPMWGVSDVIFSGFRGLCVNTYTQTATAQKQTQTDANGSTVGVAWYDPSLTVTIDGVLFFDAIPYDTRLLSQLILSDLDTNCLNPFFPAASTTYAAIVEQQSTSKNPGAAVTRNYSISVYPF